MHKEDRFDITRLPVPFNLYRFMTGGDLLHFGCWLDGDEDVLEAQRNLTELLFSFIPPGARSVLDVGCGLGRSAVDLARTGREVVGISPDAELIDYARALARENLPSKNGITFEPSSFEDYAGRARFDCLLFQESLQYLPDLKGVFKKAAGLLPVGGRVVISDEVRYTEGLDGTVVHLKDEILSSAHRAGFELEKNLAITEKVRRTYDFLVEEFTKRKQEILEKFRDNPDTEAAFERFFNGWKRDRQRFDEGKCGYEVFVFSLRRGRKAAPRPDDDFTVSSYTEGDEEKILPLFNRVFSRSRSPEHWRWKFGLNPFGSFKIKLCWHGDTVAAQYCGYPVDMEWRGKRVSGQHVGDSMTHPDYRGRVMGRRGLFVRTANAFFDEFGGSAEGKTQFMYGFNTGKVQRLGRLLLKYTPVAKVTQLGKDLGGRGAGKHGSIGDFLYSVQSSPTVPEDIDRLWALCRNGRGGGGGGGLETVRNHKYLKWRYEDCPDTGYTFWTARNRFTKALRGMVVTRVRAGVGFIVDFLWKGGRGWGGGLGTTLERIEEEFVRGGVKKVELWVPEYHRLFQLFKKSGYTPEREPDELTVICRSFTPEIDVNTLKTEFLYTMGDSDLF